ncbi:hypothetical protein VNO80_04030 [Phaseolus coccineus]|uniref:Uncharacterized protein n=1 Tax=Phaseolus coccineus TaxID=3886 RepID=A0AAN9NSQ8_PHACN
MKWRKSPHSGSVWSSLGNPQEKKPNTIQRPARISRSLIAKTTQIAFNFFQLSSWFLNFAGFEQEFEITWK